MVTDGDLLDDFYVGLREYFGLDPDCSDREVEAAERDFAEELIAGELIEERHWQLHQEMVRRIRFTGGWRSQHNPPQPLIRIVSARPRERRSRRTSRAVAGRGDPSEPDLDPPPLSAGAAA